MNVSFNPLAEQELNDAAQYYDIEVNGERNANAAWYYPETKEAADNIRGRIGFWKGVQVT